MHLGFEHEGQETLESLNELSVITPSGSSVPVTYFGSWESVEVLRKIEHHDSMRLFKIDVHYNKDKIDEDEVSERIESKLAPLRHKYQGYHISVKPSEAKEKTERWLWSIAFLCLGLIYVSLALSLQSLVHPVVVIFAIPFGFIGVVLALFAHGMPLGIMAMIGVLGLAGVVVNDSLVMTTTISDILRSADERTMREAILEGAPMRFRAVVLTSLTTLGGVFPLAYGLAGDAGWLQPMIFAVGWGLLFATLLTLVFLPAFLLILDDQRRWLSWITRKITRGGSQVRA